MKLLNLLALLLFKTVRPAVSKVDVGFTQTGITLPATKQVQNIKIEVGVLHGVLNNTDIVTLNCSTKDGTAKAGVDYVHFEVTFTLTKDEPSFDFSITITDLATNGKNFSLHLALSKGTTKNPPGVTVSTPFFNVTLTGLSKTAQTIIAVGIALGILLGIVITALIGTVGYCACKKSSGNSGVQTNLKAGRDLYYGSSRTSYAKHT